MVPNSKVKASLLFLFLYCTVCMNSVSAQSIQADADQHHSNWMQPSEGVVMALHADNTTQFGSAGLTKEGGVKPDENTIFEIGSITKVFTSILLAEAVRENLANFDDPVSKHLTDLEFKKNSPFKSITLSQLATHTSGLPRSPVDLSDGLDAENPFVHYNELRLTLGLVSFRKKQLENPGEHSYSNYGVGILGYVLTQIYQQSYRELLKEKIFDPLNMTSTDVPTRFRNLPDEITARLATPHSAGKAGKHWELGSLASAGGMISSATDLVKFGMAHWDNTIPEGLASSLAEVAKPRLDGQGLGWGVNEDNLAHNGRTGGFGSQITVNPKAKTVSVLLANSSTISEDVNSEGNFLPLLGYWSGVLNTPQGKFRLVSYINATGQMIVYSIDRDYRTTLSAKSFFFNDQFKFTFPSKENIFSGKLENNDLIGTFVQGEEIMPITMKYSKYLPDLLRKGVDKSMRGDLRSLAGYWSGYIGGKEGLFVYLKVTPFGELALLELYTPDQHDQAIAVSAASLKRRKFKFETSSVDGKFNGKLSKDLKSIKGSWNQGRSIPLTLQFSDEKPERE